MTPSKRHEPLFRSNLESMVDVVFVSGTILAEDFPANESIVTSVSPSFSTLKERIQEFDASFYIVHTDCNDLRFVDHFRIRRPKP